MKLEEFKKLVESFAHKVIFEKSISFYQLDEDNEKDYFDYEISLYKNKAIENQALYSIVVNDNNVSFEFGGFVEE